MTYQNYLNFRILEGHTIDRADRVVTVRYQYQRPHDLIHHCLVPGSERYSTVLARREHESKNEDATLKDLIEHIQSRGTLYSGDFQVLPLQIDRESQLISKIMRFNTSLKNVFGDSKYYSYPASIPSAVRF